MPDALAIIVFIIASIFCLIIVGIALVASYMLLPW